jgi:hypothetical protein
LRYPAQVDGFQKSLTENQGVFFFGVIFPVDSKLCVIIPAKKLQGRRESACATILLLSADDGSDAVVVGPMLIALDLLFLPRLGEAPQTECGSDYCA